MRITIDTGEDSYEDALGVVRRAYGRHRHARKAVESPAEPEAVDLSPGDALAERLSVRSITYGCGLSRDGRIQARGVEGWE